MDQKLIDFFKRIEYTSDLIESIKYTATTITDKCRLIKSQTKVGCCILSKSPKLGIQLFYGCNYDLEWGNTIHAELAAITDMVIQGEGNELIDLIYIFAKTNGEFTPCGACLDAIRLFSKNIKETLVVTDNNTKINVYTIDELLPYYPKR